MSPDMSDVPTPGEWQPDGDDLACAFVRGRTGVAGEVPLTRRTSHRSRRRGSSDQEWSGAGPSGRDPVSAGAVLDDLVRRGGWNDRLSVHAVTGRWEQIVGETLADHAVVESFDDGVLVVRCDSTAWATQLRLLSPQLLARLADEVGTSVVTKVDVKGPEAPSWVRGPRRVKGRGPRDTYG